MLGKARLQPKPNTPLPAPESYESVRLGPKPERPGVVAIGTLIAAVPVTGLAANFSPRPRIEPPLGNVRGGGGSTTGPTGSPLTTPLGTTHPSLTTGSGAPGPRSR